MTEAQKAWLDANPAYRPLGHMGGNTRWVARGTLLPDGTFVPSTRSNPISNDNGAFGVGKLFIHEPGQPMTSMGGTPDLSSLATSPTIPGLRRQPKESDDEPIAKDPRGYISGWQKGGGGLPSQGARIKNVDIDGDTG